MDDFPGNSGMYEYDANGNMTTDGSRNASLNYYSSLNLPSMVDFNNNNRIYYHYTASGSKLIKHIKYSNGSEGYTHYIGNLVFEGSNLSYIITEEGRLVAIGSGVSATLAPEYDLKDHLGNTRVAFLGKLYAGSAVQVMQTTNYYPFGLVMTQKSYNPLTGYSKNKYLYNGKELQDDRLDGTFFGMLDYGARFYDPQIGRWSVIDEKAEKYARVSPYIYALNNPIKYLDPDGKEIILAYLTDPGHQAGLARFLSTSQGYAYASRYMGANSSIVVGGKPFTFNKNGNAGDRVKDNLIFQSSGEQGAVNMNSGNVSGMTRVYTKDMKTKLENATEKTDISKGVAEVITLNSDKQNTQEVAGIIAHESLVHGAADANALNDIDQNKTSGAYSGNSSSYIEDLQSVDDNGQADHIELGKNGNSAYYGAMQELDTKDKTNYYTNRYKEDKKQNE